LPRLWRRYRATKRKGPILELHCPQDLRRVEGCKGIARRRGDLDGDHLGFAEVKRIGNLVNHDLFRLLDNPRIVEETRDILARIRHRFNLDGDKGMTVENAHGTLTLRGFLEARRAITHREAVELAQGVGSLGFRPIDSLEHPPSFGALRRIKAFDVDP